MSSTKPIGLFGHAEACLQKNMGTETKGGILHMHCSCKTHSNLRCHSASKQAEVNWANCKGMPTWESGAMRTAAAAKAGIYRLDCNDQWKPKSKGFTHDSEHGKRTHPKDWGLIRCYRDKLMINHSVRFLDRREWKDGLRTDRKRRANLVYRWLENK
jgi:hypothetical protein